MAMTGGTARLVASGTPENWPGPICLYVYYKEKSRSIANNTTTLSLGMYVTTPSSGWYFGSWTDSYGSYIGTATSGSNCKKFDGSCPAKTAGTRWLVEDQDITVSHNSDGTKTATIYWKWGVYSSWAGILKPSGSFSVKLSTIPRASGVTATDANIESATTITINRAASGFTHTLKYTFGSLSGTIATKTASTSIGWTVPASFYAQIPNSPSGECVITCDTYNGATKIGTDTCVFDAIASKTRCSPSVKVSAADVNEESIAVTGNAKTIVRGISTVKVVTTAEAKNGASIKSISAYCGGIQKTGAEVEFAGADSAAVYVIVTDSRGYPTRVDVDTLSLVDYVVPTIIPTISRDTPTGDTVTVSVRGKWYNGSFGAASNTLKITVRRKAASDEDYHSFVDLAVTTDGNDYTATATLTGVSYTEAYSFLLRLDDAIFTDANGYRDAKYAIVPLSKGVPVFDWGENDFQFNVPVILPKNLYFDDNGLGGLNVNNSDIAGLNNLLFADKSSGPGESIRYYRDGTNWDCLYIIDGILYIVPNFPANTTPHVLFSPNNKPYYEAGDTINLNAVYPGWVSAGSKEFYLSVPLCKPIIGSVTVSGSIVGRGVSGYVLNSNEPRIDLSGGDGYTVITAKDGCGMRIILAYDEAQTAGVVNNTPINWFGNVILTIS